MAAAVLLALAGCKSAPSGRAATAASSSSVRAPSGGVTYYTVRPGDTLGAIGQATGQNWRDIARWNGLSNPNQLEVGQVLRLLPPDGTAPAAAVRPAPAMPGPSVVSTRPATAARADSIAWMWPANGRVLAGFDGSANRGVDLDGAAGDAVLAAADGTVMYVGDEVRGLGNVVMLRHGDSFITAYAHNQSLLVKDGQQVRRGQKIAEMGSSGTDRVKLHFELRQVSGDGLTHPLDPQKLLPPR